VEYPKEMNADAKDLISKLLVKDPNQRLGAQNLEEIKQHPFFNNLDFGTIREQSVPYSTSNVIKSSFRT
jgi:serine/threonine protein kinase